MVQTKPAVPHETNLLFATQQTCCSKRTCCAKRNKLAVANEQTGCSLLVSKLKLVSKRNQRLQRAKTSYFKNCTRSSPHHVPTHSTFHGKQPIIANNEVCKQGMEKNQTKKVRPFDLCSATPGPGSGECAMDGGARCDDAASRRPAPGRRR